MEKIGRRDFINAAGAMAGASLIGMSEACGPGTSGSIDLLDDKIRLAFTAYQRYAPFGTGEITMAQPALDWIRGPRGEMLSRAASDPDLHGGEGSMLGHLLRVAAGDDSLAAIPVFILRNFTARDLYTRKGSALTPETLDGHRVGIYNWAASGAVWYRHFVRWLGQDPYEIEWVVGGTDSPRTRAHRVPLPSHVTDAPSDKSLSDLLVEGQIDACFVPSVPSRYDATDGPIVRLVTDYRTVEQQYYRDTGCYPPQHALLLRKGVLQGAPSIGNKLVESFQECERAFMASVEQYPYAIPWMIEDLEDTIRVLGRDFHLHGLERNRPAVEAFLKSAYDDRMTDRLVTVDEYFSEFLASDG